ncbi:putative ribonuclease H-like domain-containing protein [Tanacetum coccineum]|uniref:Ribonuclease H-like domain-containing protein n=1 Tax=Tanacetum coccineum TaxID=301880 RepID=A0ABQ4YIG1_9ASTR
MIGGSRVHTRRRARIGCDEVYCPVARFEASRTILAYASFKNFVVYQMDAKSAFLYGKNEEEVYVCQPLGFEDPDFPEEYTKVEQALYRLLSSSRELCMCLCKIQVNLKVFTSHALKKESLDEAVNKERDNSLERAATTATSLDVEQDRGNINKTQSKATPNEPSSLGTSSSGGPRRQETMGDIIARTRFENVSKTSNDSLLAEVNTPRSDEDRLKLSELMEFCTKLQQRVLDLENTKTAQAQEITSLKLRVKKLEKKGGSRTPKLKILYKGRYGDEDMFGVNDLEGDEVIVETKVASKDVNLSVDEVTLAQALAALKSAKPKADKVMLQELEQGTITTTTAATTVTAASTRPKAKRLDKAQDKCKWIMVEEPVKMKKKDQISLDEELAFKLQAEEEKEERLAREKVQQIEEANIVSWDNVQEMIDVDYQTGSNKYKQKNKRI